MACFTNPLNHVRAAAPCKADWQQMIGSDRVRFCGQCNLNVFNLSGMTRFEAESLIARTEGRLCVRFYRRSDGSIITQDCPVGLRAIQRRVSYVTKAILAAAFTFLASIGLQSVLAEIHSSRAGVTMGTLALPESVRLEPSPSPQEIYTLGRVDFHRPLRRRETRRAHRTL